MAEVARPYGLDGSQFSVLLVLWMNGPPFRLSPTTLSRYIAQSPSGMTHTVKRLTTAGLVHRVALASDGRAKHVELTEEGVRTVTTCANDLGAAIQDTFATDGAAGAVTARWTDTWHTGNQPMACSGPRPAGTTLSVRGTYAAPPGPDWGWRIDVAADGERLRIVMYNVWPQEQGGKEELAVEAVYERA